jgi:hypothetical protein
MKGTKNRRKEEMKNEEQKRTKEDPPCPLVVSNPPIFREEGRKE